MVSVLVGEDVGSGGGSEGEGDGEFPGSGVGSGELPPPPVVRLVLLLLLPFPPLLSFPLSLPSLGSSDESWLSSGRSGRRMVVHEVVNSVRKAVAVVVIGIVIGT